MEIYIHVGLHKTATTFLQRNVFPKLQGVNYVSFQGDRSREKLLTCRLYEDKKNLISDEVLTRHNAWNYEQASMCEIADRIYRIYPNAKIILTLRKKEDWLKSLHSQYTTPKRIVSFDWWYNNVFNKQDLEHEKYVKYLKDLFDDVLILHYETLVEDPNEFIGQICNYMNVKVPEFKNEIVNISKPIEYYQKIRYFRKLFIFRLFKAFYNKFEKLFKKSFLYTLLKE